MTVLEQVEIKLEWSDLRRLTYHDRRDEVRDLSMPHVSDLIRHNAQLYNQYSEEDRADEMPLRILLGLAFEESAARLYRTMNWQPGALTHDGIIGSPDGIDLVHHPAALVWSDKLWPKGYWIGTRPVVDEFKYTGKSRRVKGTKPGPDGIAPKDLKDIRTEWSWMQQGMSYINLYRRLWPKEFGIMDCARFHICWKFGAYTYPLTEQYVRYLVQFTEAELLGNWAMLQANKNQRIEVLGLG